MARKNFSEAEQVFSGCLVAVAMLLSSLVEKKLFSLRKVFSCCGPTAFGWGLGWLNAPWLCEWWCSHTWDGHRSATSHLILPLAPFLTSMRCKMDGTLPATVTLPHQGLALTSWLLWSKRHVMDFSGRILRKPCHGLFWIEIGSSNTCEQVINPFIWH